jgi:hypothetical protein
MAVALLQGRDPAKVWKVRYFEDRALKRIFEAQDGALPEPPSLAVPTRARRVALLEARDPASEPPEAAQSPLDGRETVLPTLHAGGMPPVALGPACAPYSPEFRPADPSRGESALRRLAAMTGGRDRIALAEIWDDLPRRPRLVEWASLLYLLAIPLFLLDILHRRTGILSRRPLRRTASRPGGVDEAPAAAGQATGRRAGRIRRPTGKPRTAATATPAAGPPAPAEAATATPATSSRPAGPAADAPATPPPAAPDPARTPEAPANALEAMRRARDRARERTTRRPRDS